MCQLVDGVIDDLFHFVRHISQTKVLFFWVMYVHSIYRLQPVYVVVHVSTCRWCYFGFIPFFLPHLPNQSVAFLSILVMYVPDIYRLQPVYVEVHVSTGRWCYCGFIPFCSPHLPNQICTPLFPLVYQRYRMQPVYVVVHVSTGRWCYCGFIPFCSPHLPNIFVSFAATAKQH